MRIKLLKASVYAAGKMGKAGETVDASDKAGKQLVLMGRAVEAVAQKEPAPKPVTTKKAKA